MLSKKKQENYLEYVPAIQEELSWNEEDGMVTVDFVNKGFYNLIAQKVFKSPRVSHIELDSFGSFVWQQIDGKRTILQIAGLVKEHFGEKAEPLYERICQYFGVLENVSYVKFVKRG